MSSNPLEHLITTVNKLQDAFTLLGYDPLSLPQICVVGGQSSGKSSVLENIVGRDFLPRGSGIVTRRPLVIQLIYTADAKDEYGIFLHNMGKKYYDFEEIRKEIANATDEETGKNKGISDKPINLKIYSKTVTNLTLVDLPGITRVAVGDQPVDIEQQIRRMIFKYITAKNAIILAVTAANTDLTNSDALQLAREVDPEGYRTIGVITKVDIMDRGTNAMEVLDGQVIPLRLGYVAVINRAQEDIDKGKDIGAQWKSEKQYFDTHPVYRTIAERCGTAYLTKILNKHLIAHIRACLPEMSAKITTFLAEKREEFAKMAEIAEKAQRQKVVLKGVTGFTNSFQTLLNGASEQTPSNELHGGARIAYIFTQDFARKVQKLGGIEKITDTELRTTIKNCIGMSGGLFIPDQTFEVLIKRLIKQLEEPSRLCVQSVVEEIQTIISMITTPETMRFTNLHTRIQESARGLLVRCAEPTRDLVTTLIKMEMAYINTPHPDFIGSRHGVHGVMSDVKREMQKRKEQSIAAAEATITSALPGQLVATPQGAPAAPGTPAAGATTAQPNTAAAQTATDAAAPQVPQRAGTVRKPAPGAPAPPPPPSLRSKPSNSGPIRQGVDDEPISEHDAHEAEVIRRLLASYYDIVRKKISDSVPKAVSLLLVNQFRENLHDTLVADLYREDLIDQLLDENPEIAARRARVKEVVALLEASLRAINDVQTSLTA